MTVQHTNQTEGYKAWLRYDKIQDQIWLAENKYWLTSITVLETSPIIESAKRELVEAISSFTGQNPTVYTKHKKIPTIVLMTIDRLDETIDFSLHDDGYLIQTKDYNGVSSIIIAGKTDKGILYGSFHLLRLIQTKADLNDVDHVENPSNRLRMMNQWDNMDGSIERGYAGNSIFYENNTITKEKDRLKDYARLLSSIGINGISINNVNVHKVETKLITEKWLPEVAEIAAIFRQYGIKTFLSINYASPIEIGGLSTADPLDDEVRAWWKEKVEEIYRYIPDFGGVVVKADSEHRPGPFTYERNHADGANVLAEAFAPFQGIVIWRCFVYNCMQDWRDRKTDRAKAAYDHFKPLDGQFHKNVVLQIKNGPMDFQVREAVSPLFGAMSGTNQMLEFQITQEYTGQQRHVCYLLPQWKQILEFETFAKGEGSPIMRIVDGSTFDNHVCGITAVSNIGNDSNWTGHQLAQANLFGYGRLVWNPDLSVEEITNEWVRLTFGNDSEVIQKVTTILLESWPIYESYTSPLGVGWMVNPDHHYGPNVDGYEYSVWGTYHYADCYGIGVDRTVKTGTGYTEQYFKENRDLYESIDTCPDELLLFFHHVPYTHKLQSGKTVIQHIYDTHFEGVEQAIHLKEQWISLMTKIDSERFESVLQRLEEQIEHAIEWRDIINTYFFRKSGIEDEKQRKMY
ncbi:alpha-glucuronidase family glycosyl hydrolase [Alkalihalobacillus sp. LMS39]|uniref:alpha-glucuronidase family glycosyl hydrolase n=1 Tax=Alkalihalobacillus sp. LMS39 TaxID=2924032 RepID=UPI001FB33687|nr:alpha-glucuronidase family glycosyl hydrolase [Alkalihalobacillus sp. LMS39]UOE93577.1 alpha-glucuronidase [Alkalihalobacillus sp. LMS39]